MVKRCKAVKNGKKPHVFHWFHDLEAKSGRSPKLPRSFRSPKRPRLRRLGIEMIGDWWPLPKVSCERPIKGVVLACCLA